MRPHWLAGSAKRPNRRASRRGNARRNPTGRGGGVVQLVMSGGACGPRPEGPEEEPAARLRQLAARQLLLEAAVLQPLPAVLRLPALASALALRVPEPRSRSVVAQRHRARFCKTARLWRHCA